MLHNICSYINYSNIAAKCLRKALKPDAKAEAAKRDISNIRFTKWVDGKPESKKIYSNLFFKH